MIGMEVAEVVTARRVTAIPYKFPQLQLAAMARRTLLLLAMTTRAVPL